MIKILYIGNKLANKGMTPTTVDTLGKQLEEIGQVITVSDKMSTVFRLLDMCWSIFRYRKCDYVIIDTYSTAAFNYAYFVSLCCRLLRKKYIPILHGGGLPSRLDKSPIRTKQIFKNAFINVSPSGYLKSEFEKRGYINLKLIPNNIPIKEYKFTRRTKFRPKLLWVRAFASTYNCEMAIEVLKILLDYYPDCELCMVGPDKDGSMDSTVKLAKKYGISDHLKITGSMTKQDWHKLSEKYDIFISTTNFDNTPVSIIEAMALGLVVVSTNVGGMPYLIKDEKDGYLVEKGNAKAMASVIQSIIANPDKNISVCACARDKSTGYDWEVVKRQWANLLS